MKQKHPILLGIAVAILLVVVSPMILWTAVNHPRPVGEISPEADVIAHALQNNVNIDAWNKTKIIRFTSMGARKYVWDRSKDQVVATTEHAVVTFSPTTHVATATVNGQPVTDANQLKKLQDDTLIAWKVDLFWFNPIATLFDEGVKRSIVKQPDDRAALFVEYPNGDGYLWYFDHALMPVSWQIWSDLTPVGGLRAGWGDYVTMASGAIVSSKHATFMYSFEFTDIAGEL